MQVHDEEQYPGKAQLEMLSVVQQEFARDLDRKQELEYEQQ